MIGFHISIRGGLDAVRKEMIEIDCPVVQIFIGSPKSYNMNRHLDVSKENLKFFKNKKVFTHGQYVLKMATTNKDGSLNKYNIASLRTDIKFLKGIGGVGTVVHIGKSTGDEQSDYQNVIKYIDTVYGKSSADNPKIILENRALAGELVLTTVDSMIAIWKMMSRSTRQHVGFCFDSCHDFVTTSKMDGGKRTPVNENLQRLIDGVGIENVLCVHLNDSKSDTQDRHEGFLEGLLKPKEMLDILALVKKYNIPSIVEMHKWSVDKKKKVYKKLMGY